MDSVTSVHSSDTFFKPRKRKCRKPSASFLSSAAGRLEPPASKSDRLLGVGFELHLEGIARTNCGPRLHASETLAIVDRHAQLNPARRI